MLGTALRTSPAEEYHALLFKAELFLTTTLHTMTLNAAWEFDDASHFPAFHSTRQTSGLHELLEWQS